ncbi:olfactory receptor 2G3-like [Fukomys damarensis]|uniref:olfactory receptor 2G3-like n=1 Tax=Fukomys damarensis TaxID=885580 RepID=UPI0014553A93|nr:olfactory receptor 2G3-like [Fukomys damarensis]
MSKANALERENVSVLHTFILLGFSEFPWLEKALFAVVLVSLHPHPGGEQLHHPPLPGGPQTLDTHVLLPGQPLSAGPWCDLRHFAPVSGQPVGTRQDIAAWGCISQSYLFHWISCVKCALTAVMAIDHYLAICWPLQYTLIMRPWVCVQMAAASWSSGLANALLQATSILQLPLCAPHTLDHFFCEVPVLINLACGNTSANELALTVGEITFANLAPLLVVISYTLIGRGLWKLPSAEGGTKHSATQHLQFPLAGCHHVLRPQHLPVPLASIQEFPGQVHVLVLLFFHSFAQPTHLHPEKQGY